ncbi:sulfatase-like hydrolase/transferase [Sphingomonas sp. LB3N6]|uniref:sulfatase-like hydrolase/transferase n=1 Tax=Sphingomonas fucosidasi TaxID=3096164 RepID=UPI002FC6C775
MTKHQPTRRHILTGAGAAATLAATARAQTGRGPRPNILWVVSEDNNPLIGAYGDTLAHTPNIDALARSGILYRNVYSNAPVCAPSRFGILTGVYPESCAPANHMRAEAKLPAMLRTYPEYLRQSGYHCSNNAKTDYNCDVDPRRIWDTQGPTAHWRGRPAGKPFMAVFNYMTTHESMLFKPTPGRVGPADVQLPAYLPDTPGIRQDYASYYNLIEAMDAQVGARLAELEADGLADDTIVFYYSDNGGVLPRSKRYCYDEGLRCALIVRVPPKWAHLAPSVPGSTVTAPVSFIDLAPTLLSVAGVPKPATMAGTAFLGHNAGAPQRYAFGMRNRMDERYDFVRTVTDGRYRYIRNYMPHRPCGQNQAFAWLARGYQDWDRLHRAGQLDAVQDRFFRPRAFEEFYDLATDPDEVNSLVGNPAQIPRMVAMRRALDAHMIAIHDNGFIPEGDPAEGWLPSRAAGAYPLKTVMALGAAAARRDPRKLALFRTRLGHANGIIRYWAATGLLVLGTRAADAAPDLRRAMEADPSPQVRIVAAEALAGLSEPQRAVAVLADFLSPSHPTPVRLQAINALTYVSDARAALPAIRAAANDEQEYLRNAGAYLTAILDGRYDPAVPLFDLDRMRRRMANGGG